MMFILQISALFVLCLIKWPFLEAETAQGSTINQPG
jgi:hypothetical protein